VSLHGKMMRQLNEKRNSQPIILKREHLVHFYSNLYLENCSWRPRVEGLSFLSIDAEESIWLERAFEEKEVWDVIRDLNGDTAPGPDGFTAAFF
jgi:hypothetical protein